MEFNQPGTNNRSESSTNSKDYPGMWQFPTNTHNCCIYRVPNSMRRVNPEAYTPQLVLIGPLHHSLKSQAFNSRGDITNTISMGYLNMEAHKKIYLEIFKERVGMDTIARFKRMINADEVKIRESYSESTAWISRQEFVEMVLLDSVFIIEFIFRIHEGSEKRGDPLMDAPCLITAVVHDLILLENQLPYFILENFFKDISVKSSTGVEALQNEGKQSKTVEVKNDSAQASGSKDKMESTLIKDRFGELVIKTFGFEGKFQNSPKFCHFTDLFRCVRVETLEKLVKRNFKLPKGVYNADKLHSGGVKFEAVKNQFPLHVKFENGCLKMPCLSVDDGEEMILRNIMAFEQCHFPFDAYVCSYIVFLDYLIDTEKDVDLLVEKGIIKNEIGKPSSVAEMVNKLGLGISYCGSYCTDIADEVNAHYSNPFHSTRTILERVYFGDVWKGVATVAAMLLLLFTLIQAVASIIQLTQKKAS